MKSSLAYTINKENGEDIQGLKGIISKASDIRGYFEKHVGGSNADIQSLKFEKLFVVRIVSVEEQTMPGKEPLVFRKTERVISNSEVEGDDDDEGEEDEDDMIKMKIKNNVSTVQSLLFFGSQFPKQYNLVEYISCLSTAN